MLQRLFAIALVACFGAQTALGASYPEKPIRVIAPFAAGQLGDIASRLVTEKMSQILGERLVVENRPGGYGVIGVTEVIRAVPDGYTIGYLGDGMVATSYPAFELSPGKTPPYDARVDLAPIGMVLNDFFVIALRTELNIGSLKELIEYSNRGGKELMITATGLWTGRIGIAQLQTLKPNGVRLREVFYKGGAEAQLDLRGGRIDGIFSQHVNVLPLVSDKVVRPIAVLGPSRHPLMPDVPTVEEQGYPSLSQYPTWQGLFCPRACPQEIVERLNKALVEALADKELQERLAQNGARVHPSTPQELGERISTSIPALKKFLEEEKLQLIQ